MADDLDIEALLEEAYSRKDEKPKSKRDSRYDRNRDHRRDRSPPRSKHKSSRSGGDRRRSLDKREKPRNRGSSKERFRSKQRRSRSPVSNRVPQLEMEPLSHDERDARTVFLRQLAKDARPKDIEEFFRPVGRIRDVRMIADRNSHRSKGISYVEFENIDSVNQALKMTGQRLLNQPVIIQPTMSEKNRAALEAAALARQQGPTKLYVGSLHYNITEDMLRAIFDPFKSVESVQLQYDSETGKSKGYGFVMFKDHECAKSAMETLNGYGLAGRPMKVSQVTERIDITSSLFDDDEAEKGGFGISGQARTLLMQKLAANHGLEDMAAPAQSKSSLRVSSSTMSALTTQGPCPCILLSNMFDPASKSGLDWVTEIEEDIKKEVSSAAIPIHIHIDKTHTEGNIYMKFNSRSEAMVVVSKLKGRFYAGKAIQTAYIPVSVYQTMFPDS